MAPAPRPRPLPTVLPLLASLAFAGAAWAGFPLGGPNVQELEHDVLQHVCSDAPATVCVSREAPNLFRGLYDASECADPSTATCVIDYIEGAELRGIATVVADDRTPAIDGTDPTDEFRTTIVFALKVGDQEVIIGDTYDGPFGLWFPFDFDESQVFNVGLGGAQFFPGALAPLGERIVAIAVAEFGIPATSVPVIVEALSPAARPTPGPPVTRKTPEDDASAAANPLATVARFRITIRFAPPAAP